MKHAADYRSALLPYSGHKSIKTTEIYAHLQVYRERESCKLFLGNCSVSFGLRRFTNDAGEDRILITGGYRAGTAMLKVDKKTDGSYRVTELYKTEEFGAHTKPPVLYKGHFYIHYSTNEKRDGMVCMSMEGEIKWKTRRSPLFDKGSMILADGLILATDGRKTLYLIDPDPTEFKPIASAELLGEAGTGSEKDSIEVKVGGSTRNWAPLALADGKLLIRDQRRMKCVKVVQ